MDLNAMDIDANDGPLVVPDELLALDQRGLARHLHSLVSSGASAHQVTLDLLNHVHASSLPPYILTTWLPIAVRSDPGILRLVISDPISQNARRIGLSMLRGVDKKRFVLKSRVWETIGGPQGLTELFRTLAPQDVKALARIVGLRRAFRDGISPQEADALVLALLPDLFRKEDPMDVDSDGSLRAQTESLILLLHIVSDDLVVQLFNQSYTSELASFGEMPFALALTHVGVLRQIVVGRIEANEEARKELITSSENRWLLKLIESKEPYVPLTPLAPEFSNANLVHPGVPFVIDLIKTARDILIRDTASNVVLKALDCAIRAKTPFQYTIPLLELVTECLPTKYNADTVNIAASLPRKVLKYWAMSISPLRIEPDMVEQLPANHPSRPKVEHQAQLEELLERLLSEFGQRREHSKKIALLEDSQLLLYMPRSVRLEFIKKFCRCYHNIDLEAQSLKSSEQKSYFTVAATLFGCLDGSDAQWLHQRLEAIASPNDFVTFSSTYTDYIFDECSDEQAHLKALLKTQLEAQNASIDNFFTNTKAALSLYKETAETSPSPDVREQAVCSAIELAARSENLSILKDVTVWSERFLNDPRIGSHIHIFMCKNFYANVLSCVSFSDPRRYSSLDLLTRSIEEGNSILDLHIDIMMRLSQLPSFNYYKYGSIQESLFSRVIRQRAERMRHFRKRGLAKANKIRIALLDSLKPILLRYETVGISDEFETLRWDEVQGVLSGLTYSCRYSNAMLPFLDDFAKERERIWAEARLRANPAVSSLSDVWPKGLPVQYLLPEDPSWLSQVFKKPALAPYIYQRAEAVIYASAQVTERVVEDTEAIGCFVDNLAMLIEAYVSSFGKAGVETEVLKLWRHYQNVLGQQFPRYPTLKQSISSGIHNHGHWQARRIMIELGMEIPYQAQINPLPQQNSEVVKPWNPAPDRQSQALLGEYTSNLTVLDCRLHAGSKFGFDCQSRFFENDFVQEKDQPREDRQTLPSPWIPPRYLPKLPLETQDSAVVAALLTLKRLYGSHTSQNDGLRYRSWRVSLDDAILSRPNNKSTERVTRIAISTLQKTVNIIPPEALHSVADELLQAAADKGEAAVSYVNTATAGFKLLALVAVSDQPQLAIDLALKSLRILPQESFWHQHVISFKFANRLPTKYGHVLANGLIEHVTKTLEARKAAKAENRARTTIKISTVKILTTQLGILLGPEEAGASLRNLFKMTGHADVRTAILKALSDMIAEYSTSSIQHSRFIYRILVSLSPAAAQPSERAPTSERAWKEAEEGGEMPTVDSQRPMQELLLVEIKPKLPKDLHEDYVNEVVLPVIKTSTENCNRWFRIYLGRLPLSETARGVTDFGPFSEKILDGVFSTWRQYLPNSFLVDHRSWALSYIAFSKLAEVNGLLDTRDKDWTSTKAGRVWKSRWDFYSKNYSFSTLSGQLACKSNPLVENGITHDDLVNEFYERARLVIHHPIVARPTGLHVDRTPFKVMCEALQPKVTFESEEVQIEKAVVLGNIASAVQRAQAAGQIPDEGLPSTLVMPAPYALIPVALSHLSLKGAEDEIETAMNEVIEAINQCASDNANMDAFYEVSEEVRRKVQKKDLAQCAAILGDVPVEQSVSLADSLRISLACDLLTKADVPLANEKLKSTIRRWTLSPINWVRTRGLRFRDTDVQVFVSNLLLEQESQAARL